MRPEKLLRRLRSGQVDNIRFRDAVRIVRALGFVSLRITGSHELFRHPATGARLNLQPSRRQAKPYQMQQLREVIERYNLKLEA